MRKPNLLSAAFIMSAVMVILPNSNAYALSPGTIKQVCNQAADKGAAYMRSRQSGYPKNKILDGLRDKPGENSTKRYLNNIFRMMLDMAYEHPIYDSQTMRDRSVRVFRQDSLQACTEGLGG